MELLFSFDSIVLTTNYFLGVFKMNVLRSMGLLLFSFLSFTLATNHCLARALQCEASYLDGKCNKLQKGVFTTTDRPAFTLTCQYCERKSGSECSKVASASFHDLLFSVHVLDPKNKATANLSTSVAMCSASKRKSYLGSPTTSGLIQLESCLPPGQYLLRVDDRFRFTDDVRFAIVNGDEPCGNWSQTDANSGNPSSGGSMACNLYGSHASLDFLILLLFTFIWAARKTLRDLLLRA